MAKHWFLSVLMVLLSVMGSQALAGPATISGSVTYRERIALPDNAWLTITLVRLPDATPVLGASAHIPARGQVPITFALNLKSDVDLAAGSFGLLAEISQSGQAVFRNPVPVPLAPDPSSPMRITVNHIPQQPVQPPIIPSPPPDLFDIVWTVTSVGGHPVVEGRPLTLSIAADHRSGGSGGCNSYFTEASIDGNTLSFGPTAATRMACAPAIMEQEAAFFAALAATTAFERDDLGLRLLDAAGIALVGLVRTAE